MLLEQHLIEFCSPTLASLKTANLFNHTYASEQELNGQLEYWNSCLKAKGIFLTDLFRCNGKALIYVYRKSYLISDLEQKGVGKFLAGYGYKTANVDQALAHLKSRVKQADGFPHEIGVFLGYPLGDVIGFIKNEGKNCKYLGEWKVYCNECEAVKAFIKYNKCKSIYARLWELGRSVWQLTVAA